MVAGEAGARPRWLEPYGGGPDWRREMWGAVVALNGRYPRQLQDVKTGWWADESQTETLCALAVWRAEIDDAGQDPREELAFQHQLDHYADKLRQQGGSVTDAWRPGATARRLGKMTPETSKWSVGGAGGLYVHEPVTPTVDTDADKAHRPCRPARRFSLVALRSRKDRSYPLDPHWRRGRAIAIRPGGHRALAGRGSRELDSGAVDSHDGALRGGRSDRGPLASSGDSLADRPDRCRLGEACLATSKLSTRRL